MRNISKYLLVFITSVLLAACVSTKKHGSKTTNFHVAHVEVNMPGQTATNKLLRYTDGFGDMLDNTISRFGAEYNRTRPNAQVGYTLKVNIEKVHFKNALASLLIGDANHISGQALLIDPASDSIVQSFPIKYVDGASAALNGISGAVLSVVVKKEAAEGTLSKGVAKSLMRLLFPKTKLTPATEERLKGKEVFQPITAAMSPLSEPLNDEANGELGLGQDEPVAVQ